MTELEEIADLHELVKNSVDAVKPNSDEYKTERVSRLFIIQGMIVLSLLEDKIKICKESFYSKELLYSPEQIQVFKKEFSNSKILRMIQITY